jgi:hypothetical protein
MISTLEEQKKSWDWTQNDGQYIPHPASYLHGEMWNDKLRMTAPEIKDKQATEHDRQMELIKKFVNRTDEPKTIECEVE